MTESSIYRLKKPTVWSQGPNVFSFSSVNSIEQCPLQWQLVHSTYGDLPGFPARPNPAAVEGDIVHDVLDRLFKQMSIAGLPPLGSEKFAEVVANVNIRNKVDQLILEHGTRISIHPRSSGFRLRVASQELVNRVIRFFRSEYSKANAEQAPLSTPEPTNLSSVQQPINLTTLLHEKGALTEVRIQHPQLPFVGILDLVRLSNTHVTIVDFKTGSPKPSHKDQLLYYAVLWWRYTGEMPSTIEARYPGLAESTSINEQRLLEAENNLAKRIAGFTLQLNFSPAPALVGEHCRYCDVRQFCDDYWLSLSSKSSTKKKSKAIDIELVVESVPGNNGFNACSLTGVPCSVVYSVDALKVHGPFESGERLRILNAQISDDASMVELMPWSEVFHL